MSSSSHVEAASDACFHAWQTILNMPTPQPMKVPFQAALAIQESTGVKLFSLYVYNGQLGTLNGLRGAQAMCDRINHRNASL